jgi:hypothetical protein
MLRFALCTTILLARMNCCGVTTILLLARMNGCSNLQCAHTHLDTCDIWFACRRQRQGPQRAEAIKNRDGEGRVKRDGEKVEERGDEKDEEEDEGESDGGNDNERAVMQGGAVEEVGEVGSEDDDVSEVVVIDEEEDEDDDEGKKEKDEYESEQEDTAANTAGELYELALSFEGWGENLLHEVKTNGEGEVERIAGLLRLGQSHQGGCANAIEAATEREARLRVELSLAEEETKKRIEDNARAILLLAELQRQQGVVRRNAIRIAKANALFAELKEKRVLGFALV